MIYTTIDNNENKYSNENIEFLAEACNNEFNDMEMQLLFYILGSNVSKIPTHKMGEQFAKYHYLLAKYTEMNIYSDGKKINCMISGGKLFIGDSAYHISDEQINNISNFIKPMFEE